LFEKKISKKEALQEMRSQSDVPSLVLQYRKLQKLQSTWLDGLVQLCVLEFDVSRQCSAPTPRICSGWMQMSTRTGL
jgi:DNA polymerase I-like protein with 3'-5' exonuclease and polymerase domains